MRYSSYARLVNGGWYYLLGKEYSNNSDFLTFVTPMFGVTKFVHYFFLVSYESHNSDIFLNFKFSNFESIRLNSVFLKITKFFPVFRNFVRYHLFNCSRDFCLNTRKTKLMLNKLPLRGQRNHSNSNTVRKDVTVNRKYFIAMKILQGRKGRIRKDIFLYDRADAIIKNLNIRIERKKSLELKQNRLRLKLQKKKKQKPKQKKKKFNVWG